jgi:hypothetical protein
LTSTDIRSSTAQLPIRGFITSTWPVSFTGLTGAPLPTLSHLLLLLEAYPSFPPTATPFSSPGVADSLVIPFRFAAEIIRPTWTSALLVSQWKIFRAGLEADVTRRHETS